MKQCSMWNQVIQVELTMITSANVQMPLIESTMLTYWHEDWRVGGRRMWIYWCATRKLAFLVMDAKTSYMTWCDVVLSLPWTQQKRWIPMGSKGWPQMEWNKPRANDGRSPIWCTLRRRKHMRLNGKKED
jgi:predicted metalloenzyme YecM